MDLTELKKQQEEDAKKFPVKYIAETFAVVDSILDIEGCEILIPSLSKDYNKAILSKLDDKGFNIAFEGISNYMAMLQDKNWTDTDVQIKTEATTLNLNRFFLRGTKNTVKLKKENDGYFSGSMIVNIDIDEFSLKPHEKAFHRQVIKSPNFDIHDFLTEGVFTLKDYFFGIGYFEFKIKNKSYSLFNVKWKGEKYLIIDSEQEIDFDEFSNDAYSVCVALGFFTCHFFQNECWQIESKDKDFKDIVNYSFTTLRDSIKGNFNPVYRSPYSYYRMKSMPEGFPKELTRINPSVFSKLCEEIVDDEKLLGALIIFMESHNRSVYLKGAGYSVTLETLTQMITDKNAGFKPIMNPKLAANFLKDVKAVLAKYETQINDKVENPKSEFVESVRILNAKIEGLNYPTNKDKLSMPFQLYKIDIVSGSEEDKAISHRNSFLHGNNLKKSKKEYMDGYEVWGVTLHYVNLLNKLILKYVGYEGHIINYAEFHLKDEPDLAVLFPII